MIKPYKTVVVVVALEEDEDGKIIGERQSEPLTLYGIDALKEWVEGFEREHFSPVIVRSNGSKEER